MNRAIRTIGLAAILTAFSWIGCANSADGGDSNSNEGKNGEKTISYKTKDFSEDSDEVLLARMLFGEARNCSYDERLAIGFTALNRANDKKRWNGKTVRESILKPWQYSCFNENDPNRKKLRDPESVDAYNWSVCLTAAEDVLDGSRKELNKGQTHYHAKNMKEYPKWSKSEQMTRIDFPELSEYSKDLRHIFYKEK